jgi:citrate synthase
LKEVGEHATPSDVERLIRQKQANNELIFGFGHAVLRVEDARATVGYEYCKKHFPNHPLVKIALHLRTEGSKVLKENPKIADPYPNIDAITGAMLTAAGFPYPEYYTVLFGLSRSVGIAIQIVYERLEARGGKGTPIIRPHYFYKPR